jgi:hypothetical protein
MLHGTAVKRRRKKELLSFGFEVLMVVSINIMPCSRAACCLHLQGRIHI